MKKKYLLRKIMLVVITFALMLPALVAIAAPATTSITMSTGPRVHSSVSTPRWVAGTGSVVYCLEQGRPFSNLSRSHTRGSTIGDTQIRGILTLGFPMRSAAAIASDVPGVSSLTRTEAQMATQLAVWNPGWGNGNTVSLAAGNASGASGERVLTTARWLVNNASSLSSGQLGSFYIYSHGSGAARQRMIYAAGELPSPGASFVKTISGNRGNLIADITRGVVHPVDGYVFYGPMSDARFTLHTGTSEQNARNNALANAASTRIGTWNLRVGTLRQALDPCMQTAGSLSDWFSDFQLDQLLAADITSWTDRVAYLSSDDIELGRDLSPGWHAMSETVVPRGYFLRDGQTTARMLRAGEQTNFTFGNVPIFGHIHIQKASSNPSITAGNPAYSLAGAQFEIRDMWGQFVGIITTDAQGRANTYSMDRSRWTCPRGGIPGGLPLGDYTIREITAPPGHVLDPTPRTVRLSSANMSTAPRPGTWANPQYEFYATATVTTRDDVFVNYIPEVEDSNALIVQKIDFETGQPYPQGAATLAGAQFRVEFFPGLAPIGDRSPVRTWVLETGADGAARLNAEHFVSGDPMFINNGAPFLPLGTVRIQEIAPPTGYLINPEVFVRTITQESMGSEIAVYVPPTVPQQVIRGDLRLVKIGQSTHERLEGVPFRITSGTTGESHVIVTDANGEASTAASWNPRIPETVNRGQEATDGVWFGHLPAMNNIAGALPFDTYIIEELRAPGNVGFELIPPFHVTVSRNMHVIDLGTLTNEPFPPQPSLTTLAECGKTGNRFIYAEEDALIFDGISLRDIVWGQRYKISGQLMLRSICPDTQESTATPLLDSDGQVHSQETSFTAMWTTGFQRMVFPLDASELAGQEIVVFQWLYELDSSGEWIRIGEFACPDNHDQTLPVVALEPPYEPQEVPRPPFVPQPRPDAPYTPSVETTPSVEPTVGPQTGDIATPNWKALMMAAATLSAILGYALWRSRGTELENTLAKCSYATVYPAQRLVISRCMTLKMRSQR